MLESLLIKLQAFIPATSLKEALTQVFSRQYREIFKNTFFAEHFRAAAYVDQKISFHQHLQYIQIPIQVLSASMAVPRKSS